MPVIGDDDRTRWFSVRRYGATGDGSTDDTAAINRAIAALVANGSGCLWFPAGTYLVSAGLSTISVPATIRGDGAHTTADGPVSKINCSSRTASLFTITKGGTTIRDLGMVMSNASAATAGTAILATNVVLDRFEHLVIESFYSGLDIEDGNAWTMTACLVQGVVKYGVRIRNTASPDAGDWTISDCVLANAVAADAAIRIETSGGGKIANCKINGDTGTSNFDYGIDLAVTTGTDTAILLVSNCSIENVSEGGLRGTTSAATSKWGNIQLSNCQFTILGNTAKAISLVATTASDFYNVVITGCELGTAGTARSAMEFTKCDNVLISNVALLGFNDFATLTTTTNVQGIYVDWTPAVTADSGDPTLGSGGTTVGRYIKQGDHVHAWGKITFGSSGAAAGNGQYEVNFPVTAASATQGVHGSALILDNSASTFFLGIVYLNDTGEFRIAVSGTGLVASNTTPMVWANNDFLYFELRYEAA